MFLTYHNLPFHNCNLCNYFFVYVAWRKHCTVMPSSCSWVMQKYRLSAMKNEKHWYQPKKTLLCLSLNLRLLKLNWDITLHDSIGWQQRYCLIFFIYDISKHATWLNEVTSLQLPLTQSAVASVIPVHFVVINRTVLWLLSYLNSC